MTTLNRASADAAAERLKVYGQPQRLMILYSLLAGERTVGDIEAVTNIVQPALSQQLAELRRADMVVTRRAAKKVFYRLADEKTETCVRTIVAMFGDGEPLPVAEAAPPTEEAALEGGAAVFARIHR